MNDNRLIDIYGFYDWVIEDRDETASSCKPTGAVSQPDGPAATGPGSHVRDITERVSDLTTDVADCPGPQRVLWSS